MGAEPAGGGATELRLHWRPYRFALPRALVTSQGAWSQRRGWLLRLEAADGRLAWGEAAMAPAMATAEARRQAAATAPEPERLHGGRACSALPAEWPSAGGANGSDSWKQHHQSAAGGLTAHQAASASPSEPTRHPDAAGDGDLRAAVHGLPAAIERHELEARLPGLPAPLACALGMALAELDGLGAARQGGWLTAPPSALLLPAGEAAIAALEQALTDMAANPVPEPIESANPPGSTAASLAGTPAAGSHGRPPITVKWKVASGDDALERQVLERLLEWLPAGSRLRLDANGGWDRSTAWRWAERLTEEPRLEWLEQPLAPDDRDGLEALARRWPVALDESLRLDPGLMAGGWRGWQVRRPLAEADPRPLLTALRAGTPRLMLSTALETGIGRRFLEHLAGLQALGPTPTAPGLAPGWRPRGGLFSRDPETVWQAAG